MKMQDAVIHNPPFARCYSQELLRIDSGKGATLRDAAGRRYIDFTAGIAVNALGHGRRDLARIAAREMRRRIHVSNLFTTQPTVDLAGALVESGTTGNSGPFEACYFSNSGTEANEAALKFARLYRHRTKGEGHHTLVSFSRGFHGRTMGALSMTANAAYREPFAPLIGGVEFYDYNDMSGLEKLGPGVAAVIVEPVQGEGGLDQLSSEFAAALNEKCREHDILLIADEVQSGLGRTGNLYGSDLVGLKPDIVTLSKPLAAGLPLAATLIPKRVNELLKPGDHGSTFGGGPVTSAVALKVWNTVRQDRFLARVREAGTRLSTGLAGLVTNHPIASRVKGAGLLRGLELQVDGDGGSSAVGDVLAAARARGLLVLKSGSSVVRIAPPLTIRNRDIDRGIALLDKALGDVESSGSYTVDTGKTSA